MLPRCGCPSLSLPLLSHGLLLAGYRAGEARKGFARLEVAVSSSPQVTGLAGEEPVRVITGMDPYKRPATIEVTGERAVVLAAGRYGTDTAGYAQMPAAARKFAGRVWAVEGCNGIGRHLAHGLVHDGKSSPACRLSCPRRCGCSPPGTGARPTRPART